MQKYYNFICLKKFKIRKEIKYFSTHSVLKRMYKNLFFI